MIFLEMTLVGTYENHEKIMIKTWFCSEIAWTEGLKKKRKIVILLKCP